MTMLYVKKLRSNALLPKRATAGSAGYDLFACLEEALTIPAGQTRMVPTGIAIDVGTPELAAFIFARSGIAVKHGVAPANCVGVVDSDSRGEVMVGLHNHSDTDYTIQPEERVAQLVLMPVAVPGVEEVEELSDTSRGAGGFGSTGKL
ncbi:MAG: dUTP diphosphatase [Oscillospiraceae bacterium]|nr:dUTP diphosphatase [Oscillospiraceae bacterium]